MELNHLADRIEKLSAQYAEVYGIERSGQWALLKLTEEVGELAQAHLTASGQSRDRGRTPEEQERVVAEELGDVLGMCLVYARQLGIDPELAVADKWFRYERVGATAVGAANGANAANSAEGADSADGADAANGANGSGGSGGSGGSRDGSGGPPTDTTGATGR